MPKEKVERNINIYHLVISGMPQSAVARHFGISRAAIGEIYNRYAKTYGRGKPEKYRINPIKITREEKKFLQTEAKRLLTNTSTIIRLAISQSISRNGENIKRDSMLMKGKFTEQTSTVRICWQLLEHVIAVQNKEKINKSKTIRLILENYQPIQINTGE